MKIKKNTLEFILQACKNTYPNEFLALLRAKNDVIYEILVIPGTEFYHTSSSMRLHMAPIDNTVVGSIHSHPTVPVPSKADLQFFSKTGKFHMIVARPYTADRIACFNYDGSAATLEVQE